MAHQPAYEAILFDLDGTLTESGIGITRSVAYALDRMGYPPADDDTLRTFVGPPMVDLFMKLYGMTREEAMHGVEVYRERYATIGLFENAVYPGIRELLGELRQAGKRLAVASSKPEAFVRKIADHFELTEFFDQIVGPGLDEKRATKADVVHDTLVRLGMEDARDRAVMVGDTAHDVNGARQVGLECVAVLYGYGTEAEIASASPMVVVDTVAELREYLLSH